MTPEEIVRQMERRHRRRQQAIDSACARQRRAEACGSSWQRRANWFSYRGLWSFGAVRAQDRSSIIGGYAPPISSEGCVAEAASIHLEPMCRGDGETAGPLRGVSRRYAETCPEAPIRRGECEETRPRIRRKRWFFA